MASLSGTESIGRTFVNNMLMFDSAWCLVMAQTQFSLIKKSKDMATFTEEILNG